MVEADHRIRCATYNVNDKLPPKGTTELASIVGDGSDDILVFGFQEVGTSISCDFTDSQTFGIRLCCSPRETTDPQLGKRRCFEV
jgi:hypothetical protein